MMSAASLQLCYASIKVHKNVCFDVSRLLYFPKCSYLNVCSSVFILLPPARTIAELPESALSQAGQAAVAVCKVHHTCDEVFLYAIPHLNFFYSLTCILQ